MITVSKSQQQEKHEQLNKRPQFQQFPAKSSIAAAVYQVWSARKLDDSRNCGNVLWQAQPVSCPCLVKACDAVGMDQKQILQLLRCREFEASLLACIMCRLCQKLQTTTAQLHAVETLLCFCTWHGTVHSAHLPNVTSAVGLAAGLAAICLWLNGNQDDIDLQKPKHHHRCCSLWAGRYTSHQIIQVRPTSWFTALTE